MKLRQLLENDEITVPIFRGIKVADDVEEGDILPLSAREDRKPKDTTVMASMLFNYGIQCRFGIPDVRKTSIYAASDESLAKTYARRPGYAVVKLQLPHDATVVFNPNVSDSMTPMERKDVKDFTLYMSKYIDDPSVHQYLSKNSGELFHELVSEAIEDGEEFIEVMRVFEDLALSITDGYQAGLASTMSYQPGKSVEFMIQGVREYSGEVVSVRKHIDLKPVAPPSPKFDADGIPL